MATLVTVTCDRCGSIIPDEGKGRRRGHVQVFLQEHYDDVERSTWELCGDCTAIVAQGIADIAGVPASSWRRPAESTDAEPDPIAVAQRVLDGDGPEGEWKEIV